MKRYCQCGRPIWVVYRRNGHARALALYDGGFKTVWMPISACPQCGLVLNPDALEDYPVALRDAPAPSMDGISA